MEQATDYSKGRIYKLYHGDDVYVGSTVQTLAARKRLHDAALLQHPDRKVYSILGPVWDGVKIELIEEYPCDNNTELRKRERYHTEQLAANLNTNRPYITAEELKELMREHNVQYHATHREEIITRHREYREVNRADINARATERRLEDIDDARAYDVAHYYKHRETILGRLSQEVICSICQTKMRRSSLTRHIKRQHPTNAP